ncbi:hypothetical protein GMOD_00001164 [Pyrenophora seminiperda CCB06]|uniref:Uncharacterized protein n=1 Tax=Pyrenophora seminiperda CCB06 TaxID=1302712 RepID=A0A3M7LYF0_9PLEO|nr:hypothetical protein GMOD_00001164 [Pyrenophora seminiperda CCB06]
MPPIPIHRNAPIAPTTAAKADGVTPSTASSDNTASISSPTRTTPAYVPATTTQSSSSPPAPQPGARPVAPTQGLGYGSYDGTPAPPQPGPTATVVTTETRQAGPPAQFSHPPPSDSMLAGRSTTTSTAPSKPGPTTINYGPATSPFQTADSSKAMPQPTGTSLEHPPGYVQVPDNAPYTAGGGLERPSVEGEGVGAQAWQMLSKAGEALKKGEESVWKAVKNKNGGGF